MREPAATGPDAASRFDGWRVVGAACLALCFGMGLSCLLGPFMTDLEAAFGARRATLGSGMVILMLSGAVTGAVLGRLVDRGVVRAPMLVGPVLMALCSVAMSRAAELWQLGLATAAFGVSVALFGLVPSMAMVANWFVRSRGSAFAIASTGTALAGFLFPTIAALLIARFGWRDAMAILGVASALIAWGVIYRFAVRAPEDVGQAPDGIPGQRRPRPPLPEPLRVFLRNPNFWLITGGFLAVQANLGGVSAYLVAFGEDLGHQKTAAAAVASAGAFASVFGKLAGGWLCDRTDRRLVTAVLIGCHAVGLLGLASQPGYALLLLCGALWGLGGATIPLMSVYNAACFGRAAMGQVTGLMGLVGAPLGASAPILYGLVSDRTGSLVPALFGAALLAAVAILLVLAVRAPAVEPGTAPVVVPAR